MADRQRLAGMLEKQSRWRKEWSERFFVMDEDCIRYFVSPPAFLEDTTEESRGTLYLAGLVAEAAQDAGRPYCIRLGRDLLSCKTEPEQRRWLQAINAASGAGDTQHTGREPVQFQRKSSVSSADKEPNLFLVHPDGHHQVVSWRQPVSVHLAPSSCALMLILDASIAENSSSASQALCRLPLSKYQPGTSASFPVEFLGGESMERLLRVQVLESSLLSYTEFLPLILGIVSVLSSVLWLWRLETSGLAVALLWNAWHWSQNRPARKVNFSVERFMKADNSEHVAESDKADRQAEEPPLWCGTWTLDKSCSEKYENILKDMGVNYLIRKAADAKTSVLVISKSSSHVTFIVKNLVTVEDVLPVDGTWVYKPVPPAGRMKGEMRLRLSKCTRNELEMITEFPPGEGSLCDTLTVSDGGAAFSRRVVRTRNDGTDLECTRVFRRT
eukprot:symbB.v1.2.019526.t1/scaffold1597.1/size110265/9